MPRGRKPTHGHYIGNKYTPTYKTWLCMKQRCLYPGDKSFARYGGRGIKIQESWLKFDGFLADMGERPAGTTLDRIDVDGDYTKDNCRWSSIVEQNENTRRTKIRSSDMVGSVYGLLTVIDVVFKPRRTNLLVRCACGNEKIVTAKDVKSGNTKSCGCRKGRRRTAPSSRDTSETQAPSGQNRGS